jgi:hypothetical protein
MGGTFWERCWSEAKSALDDVAPLDECENQEGKAMPNIVTMIDKLKAELQTARLEIQRLTNKPLELDVSFSVAALRRKVAFYCHPDRGGDSHVMEDVNVLFDALLCKPARGTR